MGLKNKILLTCKDATLLTCREQEHAITFREKIQLKIHLLVCSFCSMYYKQTNQIHQHLKKMNATETSVSLIQMEEDKKSALQEKLNKLL